MTTIEEAFEKYWSSLADAPNDSPQVVASCKWAAYHAWHAAIEQYAAEQVAAEREDAGRYRLLRRGQHWSVIDGVGGVLRAEQLDAAIDAIRAEPKEQQP